MDLFKILYLNGVLIFIYKTPLHIASEKNHLEIVQILLENKKIRVDVKDKISYHFHNVLSIILMIFILLFLMKETN